jgi:hypothetical protein
MVFGELGLGEKSVEFVVAGAAALSAAKSPVDMQKTAAAWWRNSTTCDKIA